MYIYLPIAEVSMNVFAIVGLGGTVGFLSGLFGVGGGFLMTPLLISPLQLLFLLKPIKLLRHRFLELSLIGEKKCRFLMGSILLTGGIIGSSFGVGCLLT